MAVTVPLVPGLPHFELQAVLDGVTYGLEFRYSTRESCFYADLKTAEGDLIYAGAKVVCSFPLFARCADSRRFPGRLIAADTEREGRTAGLDDLGARVQLVYLTAAEVAAGGPAG